MSQFDSLNSLFATYGKFQRLRGGFGGLPSWARAILLVTAVPGILLLALSILLILVSILALLLLTVPAYGLLRRLTVRSAVGDATTVEAPGSVGSHLVESGGFGQPGRKRVDATVVDPADWVDPVDP